MIEIIKNIKEDPNKVQLKNFKYNLDKIYEFNKQEFIDWFKETF